MKQLTKTTLQPVLSRMKELGLDPLRIEKEATFALQIVNRTPKLLGCAPSTILSSILSAVNIGLTLNPEAQECALIPRKGVCTLMPMYQGLANLSYRSGKVVQIITSEVRENDTYQINKADPTNPITHTYGFGDRGKIIGFYALFILKDGGRQVETMDVEEVLKIRELSDGYKYANDKAKHPWEKWFSQMGQKCVLKRALKRIDTTENEGLATAIAIDNQDYGAADWQKNKILWLVGTSSLDDEAKAVIERDVFGYTYEEAQEKIAELDMNQLPNHPGWNDQTTKTTIGKQVAEQVQNQRA